MDCNVPATCVDVPLADLWNTRRLERTLDRGKQLCKLKRIQCDLDPLQPCSANGRIHGYNTAPLCQINGFTNERLLASSYYIPPAPATPALYSRAPRRGKCPLRIIELAMPSKRLCMETWKTKKDVLPDFMVERLRNQIMNENVLAGIPEAITAFKRKSPGVKRSKKQSKSKAKSKKEMVQIKMISALFGSKLLGKLYNPQSTKLNKELEKISKVVYRDVLELLKNRKANTKDVENDQILNEVSDRVAIWISMILEDASYKLLQEELKELEEQEGPVLDILDRLIDDVLDNVEPYPPEGARGDMSADDRFESVSEGGKSDQSKEHQFRDSFSSPGDIEKATPASTQEQGIKPDDVITVENVTDIDKSVLEDTDKSYTEEGELKNAEFDKISQIDNTGLVYTDIDKDPNENKENEANYRDQTENIEDTKDLKFKEKVNGSEPKNKTDDQTVLTPKHEFDLKMDETDKLSEKDTKNESLIEEVKTSKQNKENGENNDTTIYEKIDAMSIEEKNSQNIVENPVPPEEGSELQKDVSTFNEPHKIQSMDDEPDLKSIEIKPYQEIIDNKDDEVFTNVEELNIPQIQREESTDKKVTFSKTDIDVQLKNMKPDLKLGPVNNNLLSNADESWPDTFFPLKPGASVTKSMESLGKITEYDENIPQIEQQEHDLPREDKTESGDKSREIPTETELKENELSKEKYAKGRSDHSVEISDTVYDAMHEKQGILDEFGRKDKFDGKREIHEKSIPENKEHDAGDAKEMGKCVGEESIVFEAQEIDTGQKRKKTPYDTEQSKFNYKVCMDTAPSWVRKGLGEPSENDFCAKIKERQKMKQINARNWISDLYSVTTKLEKWNQWVEDASCNIIYLKKNRNLKHPGTCCHKVEDWEKLQNSIDNDALLWTKLCKKNRMKLRKSKDAMKCECTRN